MAKLKAAKRKSLPDSAFVYPKTRQYPIHDRAHAIAALRLSARRDTAGNYKTVRAAVIARYGKAIVESSSKTKKEK